MTTFELTRRTALRLAGATVGAAGLTLPVTAQENETGDDEDEDDDRDGGGTDRQPIILAGRAEYWYGVAPAEIEGRENPQLTLEADREYDLVWINADGEEHELLLESDDGDELERSDSSATAGETVTMTFEATEEIAEYFCEYHPEAMRGDVEFDGGVDHAAHGHDHHGNETGGSNATDGQVDHETTGSDAGY
ncbi:cupredoxin domain-containing protein [Natrinema halophilum]|uniref:Copper binding protein, plastocyanin/azurin family n=1 Tax=Natrinema halophilum TaxID=1699371 RepID=A0A7D5KBF5_9EURY|nr:hypothetical protein [Natrinema halophilum]QLG47721.1 hypothetical protein HYG82_02085 [Natrinema halophilum]